MNQQGQPSSGATGQSPDSMATLGHDLKVAAGFVAAAVVLTGAALAVGLSGLAPRGGSEPVASGGGRPTAAPASGGQAGGSGGGATAPSDRLLIARVSKLPADDPDAAVWDQATPFDVSLMPQQMAMPQSAQLSIPKLTVKAVSDGDRVAFRVAWDDASTDWNVDTGRFCDAVAVGFPLDPGAPPMMGSKGLRMQILYWKALWQRDADVGYQDVQDLHPNYWSDLYWFAQGKFPYRLPAAFQQPESRQWFPAHQAGNPMADFERKAPVQELVAEGWGSLTHQERSVSAGRGDWRDGRWAVVISRPLTSDDPLDYQFTETSGQMAFAAWDGSAGNRGARKQWSSWMPFEFQQQLQTTMPLLTVKRVQALPGDDPEAPAWADAPSIGVSVLPQQMAMPQLKQPSVNLIRMQGLTDGERVSLRLSWRDETADWSVDTGRFCDGVAVGFPLDPGAPPMMGAKGLRMQILYWKALWQRDADVGYQDVQDLHPNYWSDLYWFAEGGHPYRVPGSFQRPEALQWFPAHQAGNPMASFTRKQPVQELLAEGWGSLTHQEKSVSTGKGIYHERRWTVVFSRPLKTDDPLDLQLTPGQKAQVALAVWDGSAGQRGGRKQWSTWVDMEVSR